MLADSESLQHRVRHLTSVQIRNLSPFPIRDAFTTALTQPAQQPQFTPHGSLSDDLDLTVGRRRGRRISSASVSSIRNFHLDSDPSHSPPANHESDASTRRLSVASRSSPLLTRRPSLGSPSLSKTSHRPRTISADSSSTPKPDIVSSSTFPNLLRDASQAGLETIFQSRLVETYITVALSETTAPAPVSKSNNSSRVKPSSSLDLSAGNRRAPPVKSKELFNPKLNGKRSSPSPRSRTPDSAAALNGAGRHAKSASLSAASVTSGLQRKLNKANKVQDNFPSIPLHPAEPIYRSHVHRPSTNPSFNLDPIMEFHSTDKLGLSGSKIRIEMWANSPVALRNLRGLGSPSKGKAKFPRNNPLGNFDTLEQKEWQVLESWDVDLTNMVSLPTDFSLSTLPSNSLIITLTPPGRSFYVPSQSLSTSAKHSRTPSPDAGYNSDPENDVRKSTIPASQNRKIPLLHLSDSDKHNPLPEEDDALVENPSTKRRENAKLGPNWQDLVKLVTLQTVVQDTQASLAEIIRDIDELVVSNNLSIRHREVSDRKAFVRQLEAEKGAIEDQAQNLRNQIDARREALRRRRQFLSEAYHNDAEDVERLVFMESSIEVESESLVALQRRFAPVRSALLTILSSIYPIDLRSPPELLFTILDVPLPIPLAPSEPAPPLSVPSQGVTDEVVATSLGYAAQLVKMLSAYMSIGLTYPLTCVGSRSMIKDNISAMVGPRVFPLYSKGVDTYRFEYAVFLLNKDIELLMSDRDLRAMDMRHTLPNLKNLLLTLTDPDISPSHLRPQSVTLSDSNSVLQSPVAESTVLEEEPTEAATIVDDSATATPKLSAATVPEANSSSSSTATSISPTKSTLSPTATVTRKSRSFLNLSPLTGLLRVRYPSSSRASVAPPDEGDSPAEQSGEATEVVRESSGDDEDDRRTIRGVRASDGDEGKVANGGDEDPYGSLATPTKEKAIGTASTAGVGSVS